MNSSASSGEYLAGSLHECDNRIASRLSLSVSSIIALKDLATVPHAMPGVGKNDTKPRTRRQGRTRVLFFKSRRLRMASIGRLFPFPVPVFLSEIMCSSNRVWE